MIFMVKKIFIRRPLRTHPVPKVQADIDTDVDTDELPEGGNKMVVVVLVILVLLGVGTGYLLSRKINGSSSPTGTATTMVEPGKKSTGVSDEKTFKDSATGTLEAGGVDGEGTHKLLRDGREDQTVYLI